MGYLGKISAIVSANTGDYVRKLNDSARTTTAFAKTVQSDLNKASSDARRSFDAILTPLQRFERAIQNAAGYKLKFRGADVAIQSIRDLTVLVSKLERQRDIDFAVKASGLKNITELKAALTSISQDSMDIVARVGLKGLVEARAKLDEIKEVDGQKITVVLDAKKAAEYDAAIEGINALGGQKAVEALIRVVGRDQLRQVVGLEKQLVSIAEEINRPLAQAAQRYYQMGAAIQVAFGPALKNAQGGVDGLKNSLDQGEKVSRSTFASVRKEALLTAAAINRIADAEEMAGRLAGGPARGRRPEFARAISRAETLQNAAMESSGGNFSGALSRQAAAARAVVVAMTEVEAAQRTAGADVAAANAEYKRRLAILVQIGDQIEKQLAVEKQRSAASRSRQDVTFAVTGKPQNIAQAEQAYNGLLGKVQQLDLAQRKAFAPKLQALGSLVAAGDAASLKDIRRLVAEIDRDLAKQKRLDVSTAEATKKIDDLKNRLRGVSDTLSGTVSDPFARLEASAERAKQAVGKVGDAKRKAALEGRLAGVNAQIVADRAAGLSPSQLASRARTRSRQLDRIGDAASAQTSEDVFGPMLRSSGQRIDALKSQIKSVQTAIAALPGPLQAGLLPQLRAAREAFMKLTSTSTAAEIRAAARAAADLEKNTKRASDAAKFRGNFGQFLRDGASDRYAAQLKSVQTQLLSVGVTAKGPVAAAVNQYQRALERASEKGTLGTERTRKKMDGLVEAIARAAVQSGKFTDAQAKAFIANSKGAFARGDVGRMGADKASLAFQQLGFAVDDFMSATGGIDQKIRAVSNNISQLAFIVGGTKGLFIALGVTMAAQASVMAMKWVNGGRTAEDQTKALNDALAKQKSLLEDLKQAFDSFANSIGRNIFSNAAGDARDYQRQIDEIVKKQKERRDARLADLSPDVQRERSEQNRINRELEGATDMGQRAALLAQRAASERREKAAAAAAAAAPAPGPAEVDRVMQATIRANEFLVGGRMTARSEQAAEERRQKAAADVAAADTAQKQAEVVRGRLAERQEMASRPITASALFGGEATEIMRAREDVAKLEALLAQLEEKIRDGGNALAVSVLEGSIKVAKSLEATQQLLDATLIPFSQTRAEADKAAAELTKIIEELKTTEDPDRSAELEKQKAALEQQSAQYRSAAEVIRTFADTVKRISTDLVNAVEGETRSIADKARRDYNRAAAAAAVDGEFGEDGERRRPGEARGRATEAFVRREAAENEARRAQDEADRVREENDRARRQFEAGIAGDPQVQAERKRLEELQAIIDSKDPAVTEEQKADAAKEKARIQRAQDRRWEDSPAGKAAKERGDDVDMAAARKQEEFRQWDEKTRRGLRGRDIGLAPGVVEAREAEGAIRDIEAALSRGELDRNQANKQASRYAREQMRSAAPAIFEMADQVQNAILQGPSRQALAMTDVSTMEGSRELSRLLRGDDASKNANIVELEKQSQKMTELVAVMKDVAQRMGIVLDL